MVKLVRPRRLFMRGNHKANARGGGGGGGWEVEWELRPGGMLVQKRAVNGSSDDDGGSEGVIRVRVSTGYQLHDISIGATSTFGELKEVLWLVTGLKPREQRLLYRGKEREDGDHLHMVGVGDKDKVLLLEDPAIKEQKSLVGSTTLAQLMGINNTHCCPLLH